MGDHPKAHLGIPLLKTGNIRVCVNVYFKKLTIIFFHKLTPG